MFKKSVSEKSFTNLISAGTIVDGDVRFSGTIKIQGEVKGNIIASADEKSPDDAIIIDTGSEVSSDTVHAADISINSAVKSKKILAERNLEILPNAKICDATIYYRSIKVHVGAIMDGCILKHLDNAAEGESF